MLEHGGAVLEVVRNLNGGDLAQESIEAAREHGFEEHVGIVRVGRSDAYLVQGDQQGPIRQYVIKWSDADFGYELRTAWEEREEVINLARAIACAQRSPDPSGG